MVPPVPATAGQLAEMTPPGAHGSFTAIVGVGVAGVPYGVIGSLATDQAPAPFSLGDTSAARSVSTPTSRIWASNADTVR